MKLCLCMIIKDEAARLERCLASVKPWIACWSITDTGSTDGTPEMAAHFLRDLPGRVSREPFQNFSQARNFALECARLLEADYDYLLLVDADMELVVNDHTSFASLLLYGNLSAPAYKLLQKNAGLSYYNVRLLKRDAKARYIGVTHEYLSIGGDSPNLAGAWFIDHADGSNREGKFERDAALLKADVAMQARSWYYYAQSLRDMGDKRNAAEAYGVCAKIDQWDEERWHALLSQSRCLRDLGE
jgi:glycosyltransferase involved in cell wall biosynthesis